MNEYEKMLKTIQDILFNTLSKQKGKHASIKSSYIFKKIKNGNHKPSAYILHTLLEEVIETNKKININGKTWVFKRKIRKRTPRGQIRYHIYIFTQEK